MSLRWTPLAAAPLMLLGALVACQSDDPFIEDSDTQVEEEGPDTGYLEVGWIGTWSSEFEGQHTFYAYDRMIGEHLCLFRWTTTPILDSEGVLALGSTCGDDGDEDCGFEFVQEVEYSDGTLMTDPYTGEVTDCSSFNLSDGSALGTTRKFAYEETPASSPDRGVLMQYYDDQDDLTPGWYEVAYADYNASLDEITYERAYAYYQWP
ncbi:MAG: hypothetical protein VX899_19355 [Myxococcota bacterium]|nr:hypothetical protein [Myxococcota bacterium]